MRTSANARDSFPSTQGDVDLGGVECAPAVKVAAHQGPRLNEIPVRVVAERVTYEYVASSSSYSIRGWIEMPVG